MGGNAGGEGVGGRRGVGRCTFVCVCDESFVFKQILRM